MLRSCGWGGRSRSRLVRIGSWSAPGGRISSSRSTTTWRSAPRPLSKIAKDTGLRPEDLKKKATVDRSSRKKELNRSGDILATFDHVGENLQCDGFDFACRIFPSVPVCHNAREIGHRRQKAAIFLDIDVDAQWLSFVHSCHYTGPDPQVMRDSGFPGFFRDGPEGGAVHVSTGVDVYREVRDSGCGMDEAVTESSSL